MGPFAARAVPVPRPEWIPRARLVHALEAATARALTVLCAPAGYGKTTALVQWLAHARVRHGWLSLDERDNDPWRFTARLLGVLDAPDGARRAMEAGASPRDTVLPLALAALAHGDQERTVVVLEDYYLIANADCHALIVRLLDDRPAHMRVVVASRTPPPLRLARRRSARELSEIGPDELRFRADETERLLNDSLGFGLTPEQIALIDERVQGWPAGVALIATALADHPDRTSVLDLVGATRPDLAAYVTEEVLEAARPELRRFLCCTSVLTKLSPSLCEAVFGDPRARELLAEVRRLNLFVTAVDADEQWLRYHPVLRDTLLGELERREPELLPQLHIRASAWFAAAGMPDEAIEHALLAGDGPRAAALLAGEWLRLTNERRHFTLRQILDRLPADRGEHGPLCEALDVFCMVLEGVDQRITHERAEVLAREHGDAPGVRVLVDSLLVSPFYGDVGRAHRAGDEAWERYARVPPAQAQLVGPYALVLWFAGDYARVRHLLEPRLRLDDPTFTQVWTLGVLSLTASDEGDAETAERYAREATRIVAEVGAETATEFTALPLVLAEALRLRGRLTEAREHLARTLAAEARRPGSVGLALALTYDARLALTAGNVRRARASAERARRIVDRYPGTGTLERRLARVEAEISGAAGDPLLGTPPTPAELRVLALLDSERTWAQIAQELYLSTNTVKSHGRRLYRRFGQSTRAGVVAAARARGVLPPR
jgi:LuxR family maltose regulon positive regulatory protein